MHVARQAVELRDDHGGVDPAGTLHGRGELRSELQGVCSLAGLDLGELGHDLEALGVDETVERLALCLDAEPAAALSLGADAGRIDALLFAYPPYQRLAVLQV